MLQSPVGIVFAPTRKGEVISSEDFAKLTKKEQEQIKRNISLLQDELQKILRQVPRWERELRDKIRSAHRDAAASAIGHAIDDVRERYRTLPEVEAYMDDLRADMLDHAKDFVELLEAHDKESRPLNGNAVSRRFQVNVLVDNKELKGAPVIYEDNPTYENLVGRIEHLAHMGTLLTDFSLIKPGTLHRANGGFLIIDARKLLMYPYAYEGLKRALQVRHVQIESIGQIMGLVSTVSLEPQPLPLDVKVILIGDSTLYYLLCYYDPEFRGLFKVAADFDNQLERNGGNLSAYAQLIAGVVRNNKLKPFDRAAVARIIEHSSRLASDSAKLSMNVGAIGDLLREADYWASSAGRAIATAEDVDKALEAHTFRSDRVRERLKSEVLRNRIYIDTTGQKVGQINGLSVFQLGQFWFGHPVRITARVRPGRGEVIDIEREVEMGGPIHSKGVLILSGFLGARYAPDFPLSLSASLVFEQSYSGVEGDSASSTELYALLSAIADVPIRQSIAVTGSVNQHGLVQPIGGVNEKIEGFFNICTSRGLTGEQGVMIPAANVPHLMLRRDVVEAVRSGKFHIYPVQSIDEGIEILTGIPSLDRDSAGQYPEGTFGRLVERRLRQMAEKQVAFAKNLELKEVVS
jgi:lon-related putative ATP-dependent protease